MNRFASGAVLVSFGLVAACSQKTPSSVPEALGSAVVATVNGKPIPESVFRVHALATVRKNAEQMSPEERKAVLDDLVGVFLLADEAQEKGLLAERTIAAQLELARMQLVARAMATRFVEQTVPTENELKELYEQNLPRLTTQQFKARNILVETQEEAETVIKQLDDGKDFVSLAQERADGPTGPNGGDLGWFTAETVPAPIADAIRSMQVGSYSAEPIKSDFGYHVLLLEDTRSEAPPSLEDLRSELTTGVQRSKLQEHIQELIAEAKIKVPEGS